MPELSYQLYCSRNFPPLSDTLAMLADAGFKTVEGYGALFAGLDDLGMLKAELDRYGLAMTSGHFALQMVQDDPDRVKMIARTLGIEAVFVPHLAAEDRPGDAAGWAEFGRTLAEAGKPLRDAGLDFGWHNHEFEFAAVNGAEQPLDLILEADDTLSLEFDVAWAVRASEDPMHWIKRYGDRITAAHVKDIAPAGTATDEDGWADPGHGTMDWAGLYAALLHAGCKRFVLEHDNPKDHARFARRSFAFMKALT
ncbi:sugar phosphate isomerase/epimerase family protein [Roseinatronobacter monicus]|uniref:sugar phosphate isomerase/epimerase family protein n=1 Tax=Roseinatronobacter monicus TaxID=393481 RepID=UPI003F412163